jgi:hypothetical protein
VQACFVRQGFLGDALFCPHFSQPFAKLFVSVVHRRTFSHGIRVDKMLAGRRLLVDRLWVTVTHGLQCSSCGEHVHDKWRTSWETGGNPPEEQRGKEWEGRKAKSEGQAPQGVIPPQVSTNWACEESSIREVLAALCVFWDAKPL